MTYRRLWRPREQELDIAVRFGWLSPEPFCIVGVPQLALSHLSDAEVTPILPQPRFSTMSHAGTPEKRYNQLSMLQERARLGRSFASAGLEQNDDYSGGYVTDGEPNG
jgi:hypothetical protein